MASISLATRAAARAFSVVNIMGLDRGLRCRLAISDAVGFRGAVLRKGKSLQLSAWIIDLFHLRQTSQIMRERMSGCSHFFLQAVRRWGWGELRSAGKAAGDAREAHLSRSVAHCCAATAALSSALQL